MNLNRTSFFKIVSLTLLVSACLFTSCKSDDDDASTTYTLTLNAGQPSDDGAEITKGETWSSSDKIAVINTSLTREISKLSYDSSQKFTGSMVDVGSSNNFALFYPAEALTTEHSDTVTQVLDMSSQDGTSSTVLRYKYAYCKSVAPSGTTVSLSGTMTSILAVADMTFKNNGTPIQNIVKLEFRALEGEVYGQRTYNFRKQKYETGTNNNFVIRNSKGLPGSATLALIPTEDVLLGVSVMTSDGSIYVGKCDQELAITEGHHYDLGFDCEQENSVAHIGDYFYSDMSVSSELLESKKCIGIVFALSDTEDGPINSNLQSSSHGRIVALKDLSTSGKTWATIQYNIVGIPDYTTIDGNLSEGYLPYWDGKSSSSYFEDGHVALKVSQDGRIESWPTSGLLSDFNGKENTVYADSSSVRYAAIGGCASYSISGIGNKRWYCPSAGEMTLLYAQYRLGVLTHEKRSAFTDFEAKGYWVCEEAAENRAWYIQFATGGVYHNYKLSSYFVRPLMHF